MVCGARVINFIAIVVVRDMLFVSAGATERGAHYPSILHSASSYKVVLRQRGVPRRAGFRNSSLLGKLKPAISRKKLRLLKTDALNKPTNQQPPTHTLDCWHHNFSFPLNSLFNPFAMIAAVKLAVAHTIRKAIQSILLMVIHL